MSSSHIRWTQLLVACLSASVVNATCNADNCYRALFPCPIPSAVSVASAFCATITSGRVTATNYPARATAACGTIASRYLSACGCGPTCTPATTTAPCTATPTAGLVYGDFECGIGSWTSTVYDPAATIPVTSPGFTGNKAVEVDFTAPEISPQLGVNARLYSPTFSIIPGNSYKLTFATWFDIAVGFIGVNVNNNGQSETDIFAIDSSASQWTFNQVEWDAGSEDATAVIVFEFVFGNTTNVEKIDDVSFASLSDCGTDVGILPNGEFECGISPWIIEIPDPAATASVTSTNPHIGKNSFEVDFTAPPISPDSGVSARIISQALPVTPGTSYLLQFYTIFSTVEAGFVGVQINDVPVYTIDAQSIGTVVWYPNNVVWVAGEGVANATIKFEWVLSTPASSASSVDRIDSIVFVPFNP